MAEERGAGLWITIVFLAGFIFFLVVNLFLILDRHSKDWARLTGYRVEQGGYVAQKVIRQAAWEIGDAQDAEAVHLRAVLTAALSTPVPHSEPWRK